MQEQRRIDRALDPRYLDGLSDLAVADLEAKREELIDLETEASFVRRLAQGRLDIIAAEQDRRARGGSLDELIASLGTILADDGPRPGPAHAQLPQQLAPSPLIEWTRGREPLIGDATLVRLPDLSDEELVVAATALKELETEVSAVRRNLHVALDAIELELALRLRAGRA